MSEGSPKPTEAEVAMRQSARERFLDTREARARKASVTARRRRHTLELTVRAAERGMIDPRGPVVEASSSTPPTTEEKKQEDK